MAAQDSGSEFAGAAITYLPLLVAIVMSITLRMLIANIDSINRRACGSANTLRIIRAMELVDSAATTLHHMHSIHLRKLKENEGTVNVVFY